MIRLFDPRALRRRLLARKGREGATVVEFALVALPFFTMMFAILELGMVFLTDSILDNAALQTSRLIRTGEVASSNMTAAQFKTEFCSRMSVFQSDCASRVSIDVRTVPQFRNVTPPDPLSNGTSFDETKLTYLPGQPGSLMLVRIWYKQRLITPLLSQALSQLKDGNMLMVATMAFRNEPYNE